ncbi:MAG: undecaprenyl-diphosphate phosphatase [Kiritimatiellia bacterium]
MNDTINMLILAIVQGLTEFLPVSSSGHLVLAKQALGFDVASGLGVVLILHLGTLVAVFVYYWKFIQKTVVGLFHHDAEAWRFTCAILISMIPAIIVGLLLKDNFDALEKRPEWVAAFLVVTGLILLTTRIWGRDEGKEVNSKRGWIIGLAQAFAMLPGISRSGSTIATSRFLGIASDKAAAFSFLMVVPIIIAGNALELLKGGEGGAFEGLSLGLAALGFFVSAVVGYLSVAFMVRLLNRHYFWLFGFYCIAAGTLFLVFK